MRKPIVLAGTAPASVITLRERAARLMAPGIPSTRAGRAPLPASGSAEAQARYDEARAVHDALAPAVRDGYPMLRADAATWWTRETLILALSGGRIGADEFAQLHRFAFEREHRLTGLALATDLAALFVLAHPGDLPRPEFTDAQQADAWARATPH